jgi:NAD(P)-dependent dehydrogenase (short-subunit alcohol dehydrogenase family)
VTRLDGKTAIVTGSASGIGEAIACLFAEEGASVAVADLSTEAAQRVAEGISSHGGRALGVSVDVTSETSVAAMVEVVTSELGAATILCNCAAIIEFGAVEEVELASWRRVLAVNLDGMFLCCRAVIPGMRAAGGGAIVNMCSVNSQHAQPGFAAYNASKGGVLGLTRQMSLDYGPEIRVNCVSPGVTDTPAVRNAIASSPDPQTMEEMLVSSNHIARRLARPREIAFAALFLASEEASFCYGTDLMVAGGQTVVP